MPKIRYAILLAYNGIGYHGSQFNTHLPTIESELINALVQTNCVKPTNTEPQKLGMQMASRTDKGVHAAMALITAKIERVYNNALKAELNEVLKLKNIHIFNFIRVSKTFLPHKKCDTRVYSYFLPTFIFDDRLDRSFRINDKFELLADTFKKYEGTRDYHNFTLASNKKGTLRYIKQIIVEKMVRNDIEYVKVSLYGSSFLLHQIRKMIGFVVMLFRYKVADFSALFEKVFSKDVKLNVPKVPGEFLLLENQVFYFYNQKPLYEKIEVDKFEYEGVRNDLVERQIMNVKNLDVFVEWVNICEKHAYEFKWLECSNVECVDVIKLESK